MNIHLIVRNPVDEASILERAAQVLYPDVPRIDTLFDLVCVCEKLCSTGDRIGILEILGHGNEFEMAIGREGIGEYELNSDPRVRADLVRLSPLFSRRPLARVFLGGCYVGRHWRIVPALSRLWSGVEVIAGRGMQNPFLAGVEGGATVCVDMNCSRLRPRGIAKLAAGVGWGAPPF